MPFPFAALAASFAPSLLGGLLGKNDPQEKLRKQLMALYGPENLTKNTNALYSQFLGSPMFAQGQGAIAAGSNQLQNALSGSLGARGLSTSGIGAIAKPIAGSLAGGQLAGLRAGGFQQAQTGAQNLINQQGQALQGIGASPNYTQQLLGNGMNFFGPFLQEWLKSIGNNPGNGGGGNTGWFRREAIP
jgi:hypothetical protein